MHRAARTCTAIGLVLALTCPAGAGGGSTLSYVPLDHWSYQAFYRLSSLGLLPLHALTARPITRLEAQRLVQEAGLRLRGADRAMVSLAEDDLRRLTNEFSTDAPLTITISGRTEQGPRDAPLLVPERSAAGASISLRRELGPEVLLSGQIAAGAGEEPWRRNEVYASFRLGSMQVQLGRTALWWGPSLRSGLMLSDNAGAFPIFRLTAEAPRVRLTKGVGFLEGDAASQSSGVVLFLTKLDWLVTPRFRLGFNEAVVTHSGGPLNLYHLLHPLPVLSGIVASFNLHDALGQPRNQSVGVDFDWLARPGIRVYGEVLIDDMPDPPFLPKIGLLGGLYLADPFRDRRTSVRLEYSLLTPGTYRYGLGLSHTYRGRTLGHWLRPDSDDLYLELTRRLSDATTVQFTYASTRHGQGSQGVEPGERFLSGVVERRQTIGFGLHRFHSPSLEARYGLGVAMVDNFGNIAGLRRWETLLALDLTYRWPVVGASSTFAPAVSGIPLPEITPPQPSRSVNRRVAVRTWSPTITSRGPFYGPTMSATLMSVNYRARIGSPILSLTYDAAPGGEQGFWSADLHYPIAEFRDGALSVFAGWTGIQYPRGLERMTPILPTSGPMLGGDFFYRLALNDIVSPVYLNGHLAAGIWGVEGVSLFYVWKYSLGAGWNLRRGVDVEIGYRGAGLWRVGRGQDGTALRWDGLYLSVSRSF